MSRTGLEKIWVLTSLTGITPNFDKLAAWSSRIRRFATGWVTLVILLLANIQCTQAQDFEGIGFYNLSGGSSTSIPFQISVPAFFPGFIQVDFTLHDKLGISPNLALLNNPIPGYTLDDFHGQPVVTAYALATFNVPANTQITFVADVKMRAAGKDVLSAIVYNTTEAPWPQ